MTTPSFSLPSDEDGFIDEYSARLSECARDILTCSCLLDPNIAPTIRRVRVASAMAELMGRNPDPVLHTLIENVMKQEEAYGVE